MKNSKFLKLSILSLAVAFQAGCFFNKKEEAKPQETKTEAPAAVTTLVSKELKAGTGEEAVTGVNVVVNYTGWLYDAQATDNKGTKFDSSLDRNEPFTFKLGSGMVIKGWDQGVAGMKVGEERRLIIPADLAYGDQGTGGGAIPPKATLVFDVTLLEVKK